MDKGDVIIVPLQAGVVIVTPLTTREAIIAPSYPRGESIAQFHRGLDVFLGYLKGTVHLHEIFFILNWF